MRHLTTLTELEHELAAPGLRVVFVSQPDCAICSVLPPKLEAVIARLPEATIAHVDVADVPEVASRLNILSAPLVLVYADGRELLREGRFIRLEEFEAAMRRFAALLA